MRKTIWGGVASSLLLFSAWQAGLLFGLDASAKSDSTDQPQVFAAKNEPDAPASVANTSTAGEDGKVDGPRLRVPPGFVVEQVAGPPVAFHPMMGGFDDAGRLYVAESAGENLRAPDLLKVFPNKMLALDPADSKGRFQKSVVFADKMTFPMGALWYRGSVYTGSPPSLWSLTDTTGNGIANVRKEVITKFGFTGNAADIHGPFLGPDGRIYWCDGRHGHEIPRPDGTLMKGKAARIFRCKPDGSELEVVCGGGMDNPVEIAFTPECEPFATVDILHARPARKDAIIYAIEGGVYPWHDVYKEFPSTGPLLPAVADLGWVAPAGLTRYRGDALGKEYQGNLFTAQFNRNRIQRHVLVRDGATFSIKTEDFLTSDDKNFHPTDVFEDADGSLLVIDTGGWFRIGCPTSKIAQPEIKGAIYRVRRANSKPIDDPRGLKLDWKNATPAELAARLDDPRFTVRDRAVDALALRGTDAIAALEAVLTKSTSTRACRNAVWALTRMDAKEARGPVRRMLTDRDPSVQLAAIHSAGLHRDSAALSPLLNLVKADNPAIRRQAATALGRLGSPKALPDLVEALRLKNDRFAEHACIFALIRIGTPKNLAVYLADPSPVIRRATVIALNQLGPDALQRDQVLPLLKTNDQALLTTVLEIIASRPGWGGEIVDLIRDWLAQPTLERARRETLLAVLTGMAQDNAIQGVVAESLRRPQTSSAGRVLLLEVMGQAPLSKLPTNWQTELRRSLGHDSDEVVGQALNVVRSRKLTDFDEVLSKLAADMGRKPALRVAAFGTLAPRQKSVAATTLTMLERQLAAGQPPLDRLAAANALSEAHLTDTQLLQLVPIIKSAGPLELSPLLAPFEKSSSAKVGSALAAALDQSPGLPGLLPAVLTRVFASYPDEVQQQAKLLSKRLLVDVEEQRAKLEKLEPLMKHGDVDRGKLVFYGAKASCSACHAVQGRGGAIGPDLTTIGAIRAGRDLLESVVFPSSSFARGFETYVVATTAGQVFNGLLARETADAIYLVTAERAEIRIPRDEIESLVPGRLSIMPQGLDAQLNPQELRDLLAYLQNLRK